MKIVKIIGRNIRSLYHAFSISLVDPPIKNAGLFAIVGPTGSGKSSILDALCLAMYGESPRTENEKQRFTIDDLANKDPRTAMSRGATDSQAEVVFESGGKQYCAHWSVHRSRRKRTGKLQSPRRSLTDLAENKVIASGIQETEAAVTAITGLSFDQFRRSVLLAQGEFEAFLKSPEDDRSLLLESITGLTIYGELSIKAHEKAKHFKQAMELIKARQESVEIPSQDDMCHLNDAIHETKNALHETENSLDNIKRQLTWYDRRNDLQKYLAQAENDVIIARNHHERSAEDRKILEKLKIIFTLRTEIRKWQELNRTLHNNTEACQILAKKVEEANEQLRTVADQILATEKTRTDLAAYEKELKPSLEKALKLDARIEDVQNDLTKTRQQLAELLSVREKHKQSLDEAGRIQQEHETALNRVSEWLAENSSLKVIADQWRYYKEKIHEIRNVKTQNDIKRHDIDTIQVELDAYHRHLSTVTSRKNRLTQRRDRTTSIIQTLQMQLSQYQEVMSRDLRKSAIHTLTSISSTTHLIAEKERQLEKKSAFTDRVHSLVEKLMEKQGALSRLERLTRNLSQIMDHLLADATAIVENYQKHHSAEWLRSGLIDGEPCPVCGSQDHPLKNIPIPDLKDNVPSGEQIKRLNSLTEQLRRETTSIQTRNATLKERITQTNRQKGIIEADMEQLEADTDDLIDRLAGLYSQLTVANIPELKPVTRLELADSHSRRSLLESYSRTYHNLEENLTNCEKDLDRSKMLKQRLSEMCYDLQKKWETAQLEIQVKQEKLDSAKEEWKRLETKLFSLYEDIAEGFQAWYPTWKTDLQIDPENFNQTLEQKAQHVFDNRNRREKLIQNLSEARAESERKSTRLQTIEDKRTELLNEIGHLETYQDDLASARSELFPDESAGTVQRKLADEISMNQQTLKTLTSKRERLLDEQKEAEKLFALKESERKTKLMESTDVSGTIESALEATGVSLAEALEWLNRGEADLREREERIAQIEKKYKESEIQWEQRLADLKSYESGTDHPELTQEELLDSLGKYRIRKEECQTTITRLSAEKHLIENRLAKSISLKKELDETSSAADIWFQMDELIGHHSGLAFRKYAQGLTLDRLLSLCNRHLNNLAPRYRVIRPDATAMGLVIIDRDQASEIRPVSSLSGGESFLVSLALALALSSLSSHNRKIDTLFIDEGFGSLDPETLDDALATLEALQSEGKIVGIISHIPSVQERIRCQIKVIPVGGGRSIIRETAPDEPLHRRYRDRNPEAVL
ncbi:AAA family ATPase [bacterium]|nr:AAA family ATPase [candidate division CSSED10-310 bacterium]